MQVQVEVEKVFPRFHRHGMAPSGSSPQFKLALALLSAAVAKTPLPAASQWRADLCRWLVLAGSRGAVPPGDHEPGPSFAREVPVTRHPLPLLAPFPPCPALLPTAPPPAAPSAQSTHHPPAARCCADHPSLKTSTSFVQHDIPAALGTQEGRPGETSNERQSSGHFETHGASPAGVGVRLYLDSPLPSPPPHEVEGEDRGTSERDWGLPSMNPPAAAWRSVEDKRGKPAHALGRRK